MQELMQGKNIINHQVDGLGEGKARSLAMVTVLEWTYELKMLVHLFEIMDQKKTRYWKSMMDFERSQILRNVIQDGQFDKNSQQSRSFVSNKFDTKFHVSKTFFIELHTKIYLENCLMYKDVAILYGRRSTILMTYLYNLRYAN